MKYEDFSAGNYYDRSEGWGQLPVPTSFMEKQKAAFGLGMRTGLGGSVWEFFQRRALGMGSTELLSPQQIAKEYPSLRDPVLTPMKRGEVEYMAERDQFETYLGNQLKSGMDQGSWGWMRTLPGSMAAGFVDPLNWGLALGSYGVLSSIGPTRNLLTNARLAKSVWKGRGMMGAFGALDGLASGIAYGAALGAVRNANNRHWEATELVAESLFSAGFGAAFGLAWPQFIDGFRQKADGAFWTNVAIWEREAGKRLKRPDEYMLHNPPLDLGNMAKMAQGRSRRLYTTPQDRATVVDIGRLDGGKAERTIDLPEEMILMAKAGKKREGTVGEGGGIKATRQGVLEIADMRLDRFDQGDKKGVPYHEGDWGAYDPSVQRPTKLYLAIPRKGPRGVPGFDETKVVVGNTPEVAMSAHFIMGMQKRLDWDIVEFRLKQDQKNFKVLDMAAMEENTEALLKPEGLQIDMGTTRNLHEILERYTDARKDILGFGWKDDNQATFVMKKEKLEEAIQSVSREYRTYKMKDGPDKLERAEIQEILDTLAGRSEDSAPPAVNMLLKDYMRSFMDDKAKSGSFFDDYVKRIPFRDIEMVGGYPDYLQPRRTGMRGSPWLPLKHWLPETAILVKDVDRARGMMWNVQRFMDEGRKEDAELFLQGLRDVGGVEFPKSLKGVEKRPDTKWFFVEDGESKVRVLEGSSRISKSILDELFEGGPAGESLDTMRVRLPSRTLDLGLHPQAMFYEEARMLANLVESGVVRPRTNIFANTTVLEELGGGQGLQGLIGKMEVPYRKLLEELGYWRVGFRNTKGEMVYWNLKDKGQEVELTGAEIRQKLEGLKTSHDPKVVEGNREVPEGDKALGARIAKAAGLGEKEYVMRVAGDLMERSGYGDQSFSALDTLRKEYANLHKVTMETDTGDVAHIDAVRNMRQIAFDMEKMHTLVFAIEEGGLDGSGVLDKGIELQNMLVYTPEVPYRAMGGDNAQAVSNSMERQFKVTLVRRIEEEGGSDLFDMFRKGMLDEDIRKIHRWQEDQKVKREGKLGTATEDGRETLMASPNAWKVYNVLVEVMGNLQESAILGGFNRPPRRGIYIGVRSYDVQKMNKWGKDAWVEDLMEMASIRKQDAEEMYLSLVRPSTPEIGWQSLSNMKEVLVKGRKLEFRSAGDEYKFLQKYGSSGARVDSGLMNFMHMETQSNVMMGAMQAIERDSGVVGVSRAFGSRPFLALELGKAALWKKYDRLYGNNAITQTTLGTLLNVSKKMVKDMVFGPEKGISQYGNTRRVLTGAMNAAVLGASSPVAFMGDMTTSAGHYLKLKGENTFMGLMGETFRVWFDRFRFGNPWDKSRRMEVSRRMYAMLETDLGHMKGRVADSELSGMWAWWENLVMRAQLLPYVTDVGRSSNAHLSSMLMGEAFGKGWDNLNPQFRTVMETHGIGKVDWEFMRNLPGMVDTSVDGVPRVWNDQVLAILTKAEGEGLLARGRAEDLFRRYETFVGETAYTKGSVRPGHWERSLIDPDIDQNGLTFNALKLATQFWGVAVAAWRSMVDAANPKVMGVRAGMVHRGMGNMLAYSTAMGVATIYMQDLIRGKTFRDWRDPSLLLEGMMKGGAIGLAGDFILGERADRKEGFLGGFVGPFITGPGYEFVALTRSGLSSILPWAEDRGESWEKALNHGNRLLKQSAPSLGPAHVFLMNTMFLESLGAMGGSRESRQAVKARLKKLNQDFLVL